MQQSTNIQYDTASQAAIITHGSSTGAHTVFTVPMTNESYGYYHTVALDLAKHVQASGKITSDNGNQQAENASTATNMALILAHGEGIPVTDFLQGPGNYQKLIDSCIQHQQLAHNELKDTLLIAMRPLAQKTNDVQPTQAGMAI